MTAIKNITAISTPYPDAQRVTAMAIEYSEPIKNQGITVDTFEVTDRNILNAYASSIPDVSQPGDGNYIILELDPKDGMASTLTGISGRHLTMPREPRQHKPGDGPKGPRERVLPDGRIFAGPSGFGMKREPLAIKVKQVLPVCTAAGEQVEPWAEEKVSNLENNKWADLFTQEKFEDIEYNLFVPENYDPSKKYPVVLFIHDAGVIGLSPRCTLEQGIGATIFASPEEQAKHPCFVVAPQHAKELPIANDMYWCLDDLHTYKRLLDDLQTRYSIDADRIYTTGQSMGFMTSIQLMVEYPEYFAAGLLPAGHWDIERTAGLWKQNIWMFLSEEDKGGVKMFVLPEVIEKLGGHMGVYKWDANQPTAEISKLIESVEDDGNTFHLTIFPGNSIMRPDQPDRTDGGGHNGTWHFVYQIEAARNWLFKQTRNK